MKIFLDTNILLDVLLDRKPFSEPSSKVWRLAECGRLEAVISAISFNNIFYIVRKYAGKEAAQRTVEVMNVNFSVFPLTRDIIGKAIAAKLPDFEDSIQFFSAVSCAADYIITRNAKDFPQDSIPVLSPAAFLGLKDLS